LNGIALCIACPFSTQLNIWHMKTCTNNLKPNGYHVFPNKLICFALNLLLCNKSCRGFWFFVVQDWFFLSPDCFFFEN
jgi:hypothetical protein